ncbi:MAG: ATP-binding protein [Candidatus Omnitrophota bacterium]
MKIKYKLVILFLSMMIVGINFIGMAVFNNAKDRLEKMIIKQQELVMTREVERLNSFMKELLAGVNTLSGVPPVQGLIRSKKTGFDEVDKSTYQQWIQRMQRIFTAYHQVNESIIQIRYIDENGKEMVRLDKKDGEIVIIPDEKLQDKSGRPYFLETKKLKKGETYVSEIDLNQEHGKYTLPYQLVIRLAVPIFDEADETFQGVIIINAVPNSVFLVAEHIPYGKMFIINEKGRYIYDSSLELSQRAETFAEKSYFEVQPEIKKNLTLFDERIYYDSNDQEFRQWKKIFYDPLNKDRFLVLILSFNEKEVLLPIHTVRNSSLVIVGIFIILMGFLIYMACHSLTEPIVRLEQLTEKMAEGDLDIAIDKDIKILNDEIGSFANSFQRMMDSLNAANKEVVAHTQALESKTEELARSNRDLEQFAYVASHDLQEPVRKIVSFSQLFAKKYAGQVDDQGKQYLDYITGGAKRMQTLISDLLKYSRVKRDRDLADVPLDDVLKETLINLENLITESKTVIHSDPLPTIRANRTYMSQLFQNLIGNAVKYRSQENPVINIRVEKDDQFWMFSVQDNGIGIHEEHLEKIFIIFERLHGMNEYEGTGIGLAICKRIVELHGGRIWAESNGNGTVFKFTLKS